MPLINLATLPRSGKGACWLASQVMDQMNEIDGKELLQGVRDLLPRLGRKKAPLEALG